jgi:hypothetical protein
VLLRGRRTRGFEAPQDVIAEVDRIGESLEAQRVIRQAGDRQRARDGAQRDDDVVEAHGHHVVLRLDACSALCGVELGRAAEDQLRMRTHQPERHDDVTRLERP